MLSLFLAAALGQLEPAAPEGPVVSQPSQMYAAFWSADYAFFEFAPTSGAGMTAACACTTPTGAKGETLTFTRTGAATCSKQGLATTGIGNGDLVVCANNNEPRVESSGGVLGLRVESARTNFVLRSQELNNAAWTWENSGAAATTRTSDYAVAPDGTTTAERLEIPATTGAQFSDEYQTWTAASAGAAGSCSVYVKGTAAGESTDLCGYNGSVWSCTTCTFVAGSWSRCQHIMASGVGTSRFCKLGNNSNQNGGVARNAVDVLAWGFQGEDGAYATSYIPTVAASATRNAEAATAAIAVSQHTQCQSATVELLGTSSNDRIWVMTRVLSGSGDFIASYTQAAARADTVGSGAVSVTGAGSAFGAVTRFLTTWNGSTLTVFRNATQTGTVTTANTLGAATIVGLGGSPAGASLLDGIVSRVQVDPSPSRCTP